MLRSVQMDAYSQVGVRTIRYGSGTRALADTYGLSRGIRIRSKASCFSPDGTTLASGSGDGTVRLWDVETRKCTFTGHTDYIFSVAFRPDGRILAIGSRQNKMRLLDVATGDTQASFTGHTDTVLSVAFSPDGRILASGSGDGTVRLWDVETEQHQGHTDTILSVAFSPDGRILASGSKDNNTIRLWDADTGHHLQTLEGHTDWVFSVAFSPDGRILASGSSDGTVRLWELSEQTIADVLDQAIVTVAEKEFNRLRKGLSDAQVTENVAKALEELEKLRTGGEPDYNNEWVALFYVTWYQPHQINTALKVLQQLYEEQQRTEHPLHIIDVGCGALAVQFATAISAAEYQHTNVAVTGIDPSEPMRKIGAKLWSAFRSIVAKSPDLSNLSRTCQSMPDTNHLFKSHQQYYRSEGARVQSDSAPERWLLAMYVVSEQDTPDPTLSESDQKLKDTLQTIRETSRPSVILVTCHEIKRERARLVIGEYNSCEELKPADLPFTGYMSKTTEWRQSLIDRLPEIIPRHKSRLNNPVEWNPSRHTVVLRGD